VQQQGKRTRITSVDVQRIQEIFKRTANAAIDVTDSGKAIVQEALSDRRLSRSDALTATCILALKGTSEHIAYSLHEVLVIIGASSAVKDSDDERVTLSLAKVSLNLLIDYLPSARATISEIQVGCRDSGLVSAKAQLVLGLIPLIDSEIGPLAKRVGVRLR
jgi:hypothetical protein